MKRTFRNPSFYLALIVLLFAVAFSIGANLLFAIMCLFLAYQLAAKDSITDTSVFHDIKIDFYEYVRTKNTKNAAH